MRSRSAHCARKLAKRLAKNWQGGSGCGSGGRDNEGGGGRGEGGGKGGGEGGGSGITMIKFNTPHLVGSK